MNFISLLSNNPHITIFGLDIYAYALTIVFGMLMAFLVISILFKRRNMSVDLFMTFFCIALPIAIFTTRLFYCITSGMPVEEWFSFESIRQGGLSIVGGILGGAASVAAICYFKKVNFFRVGDCVVVGVLLAQAIGRWGNFFNQEVYGAEITNPALQCFPFGVYINTTAGGSCWQTFTLTFAKWFNTGADAGISGGTWHYAFFLYESVVTFSMAILLFLNAWKNPKKPNGINVAMYFITYGLVRTIMEPLRDPTFILGKEEGASGIPWSMVFSIILLIFGIALLFYVLYKNKLNEGAWIGSTKHDPYGITQYVKDAKDEVAYFNSINMMCQIHPENYVKKEENGKKDEENAKKE